MARKVAGAALLATGLFSARLQAAGWPWNREPDEVSATCSVEPGTVEAGPAARATVRIEAKDSKGHPLQYRWSSNAGKLMGGDATVSPEVQIDLSGLNPGSYAIAGAADDGKKHRGSCVARVQVVPPARRLAASCSAAPESVVQGGTATITVAARDARSPDDSSTLRYQWFTNGGELSGTGPQVQFHSDAVQPGEYVITSRVENTMGDAADCIARVRVTAAPPPPPPAELLSLAQIVFARNQSSLTAGDRMALQRVLERLRSDPGGNISIESYAGPDEKQPEKLAQARADAVRKALLDGGADPARLHVQVGLGGRLGGVRNRTLDVIWVPEGMLY